MICSALLRHVACNGLPCPQPSARWRAWTPDPRFRAAAPYLNRIHLCSSLRRCRPQIRRILHPAVPTRRSDGNCHDCLPVNLVNVERNANQDPTSYSRCSWRILQKAFVYLMCGNRKRYLVDLLLLNLVMRRGFCKFVLQLFPTR